MWDPFKRRAPPPPPTGPEDLNELIELAQLSEALREEGALDRAVMVGKAALEGMERAFGREDENTLIAAIVQAHNLLAAGDIEAADAIAAMVVEVRVRTRGPTHPDTYQAKDVHEAIRIAGGWPPP